MLRMIADSGAGLNWMTWLSPLGWIEQARPLTGPRPLALLPVVVLIVVLTGASLHLAGARDAEAATWPDRDGAVPRLALLGGPAGLAFRLTWSAALGWLLAVTMFSVLLGTVAVSSSADVGGDRSIQQAVGRLGGHATAVTAYLGLTFLVLALLIALAAASQLTAVRAEEADGHLERLVVGPVSRTRWLAQRLLLSASVVLLAGVLAGIGTWAGAASQHGSVQFGTLVAAGLNLVPASLLLLGFGTLALGLFPRRASAIVYGYLAWSFLIEFMAAIVYANHWLLDTSVFFHMAPAPATSPDWASAAVIAGLGAAAAATGAALLRRRDLLDS
jgi:ABC-2 type transport system permease protein